MELLGIFLFISLWLSFVGLIQYAEKKGLMRLLKQLESPDQGQRIRALDELIRMGPSRMKTFIKALQHKSPVVRKGIVKVLGKSGDLRVIEPLIKAARDKHKPVRYEAITALGRTGDLNAAEFLIRILENKNQDPGMRWRAASALGETNQLLAVGPLLNALEEQDGTIRKKAIEALGKIKDQQAIGPLVKMLEDGSSEIRSLAAEALDKLSWKPETEQERIAYYMARGNWDSLILSGSSAIESLITALEDESINTRVNAMTTLGKIGDVRAIEPLINILKDKILKDEDVTLRETAAIALGDIANARAVEPLIETLKDKRANIRMAAVTALGKIGDPRSLEALIQVVGGKNPAMFGDRNPEVQKNAVEALRKIEDPRVKTTLIYALEDDDAIVRLQAAEVLDKIGWTPEKETETISYHIARGDWEALIPFGGQAVTPLIKIANDKDRNIREHVADTLTKILACIKITVFGDLHVKDARQDITLCNPNVAELTVRMQELEHIVLHTPTYDFHQVERFMTYAVNYIGQEYLKKHVVVHIYGDPDKLHPNLRNSFENLCKQVVMAR
jgi:HEAT repeat protein